MGQSVTLCTTGQKQRCDTCFQSRFVFCGKDRVDVDVRAYGEHSVHLYHEHHVAFVALGAKPCKLSQMLCATLRRCVGEISDILSLKSTALNLYHTPLSVVFGVKIKSAVSAGEFGANERTALFFKPLVGDCVWCGAVNIHPPKTVAIYRYKVVFRFAGGGVCTT